MINKKIKLTNPFLIAEIGINHNGSLNLAKKLIDLAKENGFSAVKFQKRNPNISTPEDQKNKLRITPWGEISYLEYKKKIEFGKKEFDEINRYCKKKKIIWFASAWDLDSQKFLKKYKLKYNKIASAMLTNHKLLEEVSKERKMTLISTGMSYIKDIARCIKFFKNNKCKFILMHCVSTYPCPIEKLNLNMIITLKINSNARLVIVAMSPSFSIYISLFLGARYIERHITLTSMWGTDQSAFYQEVE